MAKAVRPNPTEQGSWKELYKHFFGRLIQYKPEMMSIRDWLNELFNHSYRGINRYRTRVGFKMPGLLYQSPTVKIQGIGIRGVGADTVLFVRTDDRAPDNIDVEWVATGQVFCLTGSEWNSIAAKMDLDERGGRVWPVKCVRCGEVFLGRRKGVKVCGEC